MFKKEKKLKSNKYFDSFPVLAHYSVECGQMILDFMNNFDVKKLEILKSSVHEIEHKADEVKHAVTDDLLKEFMTPIDREDIFELLKLIDDITDSVEEISLKLYLYNYEELPPNTIPFMESTLNCLISTERCLKEFPHYLDKEAFEPFVNEVVKYEEQGDDFYIENIRNLYLKEKDGFKRHKAEAMYTMLEEISDKCRETIRFVHNIALKNI